MLDLKIKTQSDNMEIIASGLGFTFGENSDFEVYLSFDEAFKFTVRFQFEDDTSTDKSSLRSTTNLDKNIITIICVNFNDFIGTGTLKPLDIAVYKDKNIYLKFWVRTPEEKITREIRYCFYMEQNDEQL